MTSGSRRGPPTSDYDMMDDFYTEEPEDEGEDQEVSCSRVSEATISNNSLLFLTNHPITDTISSC